MGEELNKDGEHSSEAIADNMGNVNTGSASPGYTNGMGPGTPPPPGYMNGGMGVPPQGYRATRPPQRRSCCGPSSVRRPARSATPP